MATGKKKNKGGRPTRYKAEYCKQAYKLCLLGATDVQLADFFGVSEKTLNTWKKAHPTFLQSLKDGKENADAAIAASLYGRAKGYSHPEDKIFNNGGEEMIVKTERHYPPDTTACIFWLKNRQPAKWRDKQEVEHSGTVDVKSALEEMHKLKDEQ